MTSVFDIPLVQALGDPGSITKREIFQYQEGKEYERLIDWQLRAIKELIYARYIEHALKCKDFSPSCMDEVLRG